MMITNLEWNSGSAVHPIYLTYPTQDTPVSHTTFGTWLPEAVLRASPSTIWKVSIRAPWRTDSLTNLAWDCRFDMKYY